MNSKKLTTISLIATFGLVVAGKAYKGTFPKPKVFVGLALAFVFIGFGAEFAPDLAAAMAMLVFVGFLMEYGPEIFAGADKALGTTKTKTSKKTVIGGKK